MILKLEPFAGSDISGCAQKAVAIANKIEAVTCFDFNGVECHASPGDDAELLVGNYRYAIRYGTKPLIVFANPLPKTELLPCPFCGGEADFTKLVGFSTSEYCVSCQTKDCWVYENANCWENTLAEAAKLWNNRKGGGMRRADID